MESKAYVKITPDKILSSNNIPVYNGQGLELLVSAFKSLGTGYAKFYKMDTLSKLGFLASEILLGGEEDRFAGREDRAVALMNSSSSLCDDRHYVGTIENPDNYFPSPSVFVYTLPNIVTGEIAIRNKYYGQTCFHVLQSPDTEQIYGIVSDIFRDRMTASAICGWAECKSDDDFLAVMFLVNKEDCEGNIWNPEYIRRIMELE